MGRRSSSASTRRKSPTTISVFAAIAALGDGAFERRQRVVARDLHDDQSRHIAVQVAASVEASGFVNDSGRGIDRLPVADENSVIRNREPGRAGVGPKITGGRRVGRIGDIEIGTAGRASP